MFINYTSSTDDPRHIMQCLPRSGGGLDATPNLCPCATRTNVFEFVTDGPFSFLPDLFCGVVPPTTTAAAAGQVPARSATGYRAQSTRPRRSSDVTTARRMPEFKRQGHSTCHDRRTHNMPQRQRGWSLSFLVGWGVG
jgi:hypothetical protein